MAAIDCKVECFSASRFLINVFLHFHVTFACLLLFTAYWYEFYTHVPVFYDLLCEPIDLWSGSWMHTALLYTVSNHLFLIALSYLSCLLI